MLNIPGRRASRTKAAADVVRTKVVANEISTGCAELLRQIKDGKIHVSRSGLDITVTSTVKGADFTELRFALAAAGAGELAELTGSDTPWWGFGEYTVTLTALGEAVLATREALARSGNAATQRPLAQTAA
jgi:hypothetical protein